MTDSSTPSKTRRGTDLLVTLGMIELIPALAAGTTYVVLPGSGRRRSLAMLRRGLRPSSRPARADDCAAEAAL